MYVVVNYKNYQRLIEILFIFSRSFVSRQEWVRFQNSGRWRISVECFSDDIVSRDFDSVVETDRQSFAGEQGVVFFLRQNMRQLIEMLKNVK